MYLSSIQKSIILSRLQDININLDTKKTIEQLDNVIISNKFETIEQKIQYVVSLYDFDKKIFITIIG